MGLEKDLLPGKKLVACFRPFLEELAVSDLSPKTIRKHVDNLWALGGEIIRYLHDDPSLRTEVAEQFSRTESTKMVARWSTPWNPRNSNSVPSIPPARNSTGSSDRPELLRHSIHPQISPTRQIFRRHPVKQFRGKQTGRRQLQLSLLAYHWAEEDDMSIFCHEAMAGDPTGAPFPRIQVETSVGQH